MKSKPLIHQLALDAATAVFAWLVILLAIEILLPGFVSRFFNLVWLVLIAFAATLTSFITQQE